MPSDLYSLPVPNRIVSLLRQVRHHCGAETATHSLRVGAMASRYGTLTGADPAACVLLFQAGCLHDLGKLFTGARLLHARRSLTDREWRRVQAHPAKGARLLRRWQKAPRAVIDAALGHHERWDGQGYPRRLRAQAIPPVARLIALADSTDAMLSTRAYSPAQSPERVRAELLRDAARAFDPALIVPWIDAFDDLLVARAAVETSLLSALITDRGKVRLSVLETVCA